MNNIDSESSIFTQGGKDHASGRYVFTCLSPITRFLFPKEDDILLDYLREDGQSIEPIWQVSSVMTHDISMECFYCADFLFNIPDHTPGIVPLFQWFL